MTTLIFPTKNSAAARRLLLSGRFRAEQYHHGESQPMAGCYIPIHPSRMRWRRRWIEFAWIDRRSASVRARTGCTHADAGGEFETQKQCDCAARYRDAPGGRRDADPVTKCDCDTSPRQHADSNDVAGE